MRLNTEPRKKLFNLVRFLTNTSVTRVDSVVHELELRPEMSLLDAPIGGSEST